MVMVFLSLYKGKGQRIYRALHYYYSYSNGDAMGSLRTITRLYAWYKTPWKDEPCTSPLLTTLTCVTLLYALIAICNLIRSMVITRVSGPQHAVVPDILITYQQHTHTHTHTPVPMVMVILSLYKGTEQRIYRALHYYDSYSKFAYHNKAICLI